MKIEEKVARCMDALDARNKEVGFKTAKEWLKSNFGEVGMSEGTFYRAKRIWLASHRKEELYEKVDSNSVQSPQTIVNKEDTDNISLTDLKRVAVLVKEMGRVRVRKCLECLEEVQVG